MCYRLVYADRNLVIFHTFAKGYDEFAPNLVHGVDVTAVIICVKLSGDRFREVDFMRVEGVDYSD